MRRIWIVVLLALLVALGLALYKSRTSGNLNVEPHAREQIEKAKQR
jgi:hypothetical protein